MRAKQTAGGWNMLHAFYALKRINHSVAFSLDSACINRAESFFSRLRRADMGQHHHISGKYLAAYAVEMAWREDGRRMPTARCINPLRGRRWRIRCHANGPGIGNADGDA